MNIYIRGDKEGGFDDLGVCSHKNMAAGQIRLFYIDMARLSWQPPFFGSVEEYQAWKPGRTAGLPVFDPCIKWGCSLAEVEEYVQNKQWWKPEPSGKLFYAPSWKDFWVKEYKVADDLFEDYFFDTEDGQHLEFVMCGCPDENVPIEAGQKLVESQGFIRSGKEKRSVYHFHR